MGKLPRLRTDRAGIAFIGAGLVLAFRLLTLTEAASPNSLDYETQMLKGDATDCADAFNEQIKPGDAKAWAAGTTLDWANESMKLAATSVYPGLEPGTTPHLPQSYVDKAEPVIEQQLERGGVRLAMVLNKALGGTATTPPAH